MYSPESIILFYVHNPIHVESKTLVYVYSPIHVESITLVHVHSPINVESVTLISVLSLVHAGSINVHSPAHMGKKTAQWPQYCIVLAESRNLFYVRIQQT
jgi:hypothetical protein